jgi:hypothetical protein
MFVVNTIDVEVRGVADQATIVAVRQTVRNALGHLVGAWLVQVSPSEEQGRWDLHVRGAFGHHLARFLAAPDYLADRIERRLRAFLQGVVPPLSAAPRRPVLVIRSVQSDRTPDRLDQPARISRQLHRRAS